MRENVISYCKNDVSNTLGLYRMHRCADIEHRMMCIRKEIDSCDDFWMRCKLARKLKRLRVELKRVSTC